MAAACGGKGQHIGTAIPAPHGALHRGRDLLPLRAQPAPCQHAAQSHKEHDACSQQENNDIEHSAFPSFSQSARRTPSRRVLFIVSHFGKNFALQLPFRMHQFSSKILSRKIKNNTSTFKFVQSEPVNEENKVLPRNIRVGIYDSEILISNEKQLYISSTEENTIYDIMLTLKAGTYSSTKDYRLKVIDKDSSETLLDEKYIIDIGIANEFF